MSTVALVSLGRTQAMGEVRRVSSWRQLFHAVGADVVEIATVPDRRMHLDGVGAVVRGWAPPERLVWSGTHLRAKLTQADPDVVVVVSARAFDPRLLDGPWTIVVDQVDSLSRSYRDRADIVGGWHRRTAYRALARLHARTEQRLRSVGVRRAAAGWSDALALDAEWIPNLVDDALVPTVYRPPDVDVLFFGTLRYPPNVDALERLARVWPSVVAARPGTSALVAGSSPTGRVTDLCRTLGWELIANFTSLPEIAARARVAISPLTHVAGIQNKVLDAAVLGVPQVVTAEALQGFEPGLPLTACATDIELVTETVRLLDDPAAARVAAVGLRRHVADAYGTGRWSPWAAALIAGAGQSAD